MATATPTMPLHCNICPKMPDFSDVSHLLTHIASKGHLSHYYKIKVRSGHDLNAKNIIDAYDQWYADYNVEHLMSERMHLKDRKRPRLRGQAPPPNSRKQLEAKAPTLDPLLSTDLGRDGFLLDHLASMTSYPPYPPWPSFQPAPAPKLYKPRVALWRTVRPKSLVSMGLDMPSSPLELSRLSTFRQVSGVAPQAKMWTKSPFDAPIPLPEELDGVTEATRLKGVYWPGMDIFDAATPEMKRKRNQKKDTSVAIQLERHSLIVEPTEMIFTPLGSLKKSRVISGQVDFDSSPDKLSPPTPKPKRRLSSRLPLAKRDANATTNTVKAPDVPPFPGYGPVNNNAATTTRSITTRPTKKQKRKFEVFEDEPLQQQDNATGMKFLTAGFRPATQTGLDTRPQQLQTLVDINTGAMYHNNLFAEAFETFQPTFYGMPYYGHGYYGHAGFAFPGLFPNTAPHLPTPHDAPPLTVPPKIETAEDAGTVSAKSDD